MDKTADQFQSFHLEGGTLLVLSVVVPCLEGEFRRFFVSALLRCVRKGSHQGKFPDVSEWTKAMLFGHGGGTEIQELSMTCVAQAAQKLLLQLMTATYGFQLGRTLKATPPCWIMLFVKPQNGMFRLKLYEIGCMMRNFTPDVHGEIHIWHLDPMHRSTDGPNNTLNVLLRIDIKFYSQMSVAYAINQTIAGDVFGGSLDRLNVLETPVSECSKVVVPWCFGMALCEADVCHWWSWKALKRLYDIGMTYSTFSATISAEFRRGIRLNGRQFSPSSCISCEWIPSW